LFQLDDDKRYFPPYQAVFVARQQSAETLNETFEKLSEAISVTEMRQMNYEVDGNKRTPREVAANWIKVKNL
jgi:glycine betaine/choline ABC-type transport system substrate-binding protein